MREEMRADAFAELVADIKARGLLQPLIVTAEGERFRLVAGYRRWRAALEAGLTQVPCMEGTMNRITAAATTVVENLHREDVSPLDAARKFAELEDKHGFSTEEIAQLVGKSVSFVGSRLAILRAPTDVRKALQREQINFSVARELARCPYDQERGWLLGHASRGGATVDTVRAWVDDVLARRERTGVDVVPPPEALSPAISPVVMLMCEWHRGEVPLEATMAFRVCGPCYTYLQQLRTEVARQEQELPAGASPQGGDPGTR